MRACNNLFLFKEKIPESPILLGGRPLYLKEEKTIQGKKNIEEFEYFFK